MTEPKDAISPPLPEPATQKRSMLRFEPSRPAWRYILRMGGIAFFGGILVSIALGPLLGGSDLREEVYASDPWLFAIEAIVIAPPLETLVMAFFFFVARFVTKDHMRLAVACAVFWGALHTINSPLNGVAVLWPFYIMSRAYLAWRALGFWKALGVTTLIHSVNNVVPALIFVMLTEPPPATPDPTYGPVIP